MREIQPDVQTVSYCGLFCGACGKYLKERCPGCMENEKASWCKLRSCCIEHGFRSCADCTIVDDPIDCKKFNNFISKVFAFIFKTDRYAGIMMIKEKGIDAFAQEMADNKRMAIKRK